MPRKATLEQVIHSLRQVLELATAPRDLVRSSASAGSSAPSSSASGAGDNVEDDVDGLDLEDVQDALDLFTHVDLSDRRLGERAREVYEDLVGIGPSAGKGKGKERERVWGEDDEAVRALKAIGEARIRYTLGATPWRPGTLSPRSLYFAYSLMLRQSYLTRRIRRALEECTPIPPLHTALDALLPPASLPAARAVPVPAISAHLAAQRIEPTPATTAWARMVLACPRLYVAKMEPPLGARGGEAVDEATRDECADMARAREGVLGLLRDVEQGRLTRAENVPACAPIAFIASKMLGIADRVLRDQAALIELTDWLVGEEGGGPGGGAHADENGDSASEGGSASLGDGPMDTDDRQGERSASSLDLEDLAADQIKEEQDGSQRADDDEVPDSDAASDAELASPQPLFAAATSPHASAPTPPVTPLELTASELAAIARMRTEPGLWQSLPSGEIVKVEISSMPMIEHAAVGEASAPRASTRAAGVQTGQRQRVTSAPHAISGRATRPSMLPLPMRAALSPPPPAKHTAKRRRHTEGPAVGPLEERTRQKRAAEQALLRGAAGNPVARALELNAERDHDEMSDVYGGDNAPRSPAHTALVAGPAPSSVHTTATRIMFQRNRFLETTTRQITSGSAGSKRFANFDNADVVRFDKKPRRSVGRADWGAGS